MRPVLLAAAACPNDPVPAWFAPAFPFFFVGMWIAVSTVLAWRAGHFTLLARFPPQPEPLDESFSMVTGKLRGVGYNNALRVGLGARGLHLAASWPVRPIFAMGIPCIPWHEVKLVPPRADGWARALGGATFEVPAVGVRVTLYGRAGEAVERRLSARQGGAGPRRTLVRS
jgi:hypothetical protein